MMSVTKTKNQVPSIHKAIDILALLYEQQNLSVKDITSSLGLPASTCYNILTTLESRGLIAKDPQTSDYTLGVTLLKWGLKLYRNMDIRKIALPYLEALTRRFGESAVLLGLNLNSYESMVLEKVNSTHVVRAHLAIGNRYPLYVTAGGKCFLAFLPPHDLDRFFREVSLESYSMNTITQEMKLREELEKIRQQNYAVTRNEFGNDAASLASPIIDRQGNVVGVISLTGPLERMNGQIPNMIDYLKEAAEEIGDQL